MDEFQHYVQLKPRAPNTSSKLPARPSTDISVDLFWIDEAGSQHRRKLINTHAQKRSRLLKRLKNASVPETEPVQPKEMGRLIQFLTPKDTTLASGLNDLRKSDHPRVLVSTRGQKTVQSHHRTAVSLCSGLFRPMPDDLVAGFDSIVTFSGSLTHQAGDLLKFAKKIAICTETISSHWGKSCVASLGLSWSLSCPVRLLHLLERASAYVDTMQGVDASPRTIFWRHAVIRRLTVVISDPQTRYGDEVLYGIISLLHGYLHRLEVKKGVTTIEGAHSAGLRDFISHHGGWNKLRLPTQLEQFVRMSMIMTSRRLGSYLDNLRVGDLGDTLLLEWHEEVERVVSRFGEMATWASQRGRQSLGVCSPLLDGVRLLLTAETSTICDHCHKIFVLVWLALTRWHARTNVLRYKDMVESFHRRLNSLPHRALQDVSWAIISSRAGEQRSHWQTVETLKVLHRIKATTLKQVSQWLFDFTCGTGTGAVVSMASDVCRQIQQDAFEGLPKIRPEVAGLYSHSKGT